MRKDFYIDLTLWLVLIYTAYDIFRSLGYILDGVAR